MTALTSLGNFRIPNASGPGVHADELDSAWQTVRGMLPASTARELLKLGDIDADLEPRSNPAKKGGTEAEPVEDKTIATALLAYPTMLVTGQWGKPPIPERHRSLLPLHNPPKINTVEWDRRPFFTRLADLSELLGRMVADARQKYLAKRPAVTDARKQGWAWALLQAKHDVDWVISQRELAYDGRARAVEHDSNGVLQAIMGIRYAPGVAGERLEAEAKAVARAGAKELNISSDDVFWRQVWGIVAAKGNGKLPFAAYSTAPMASCPAAGTCAVQVGSPIPSQGYGGDTLVGYCYSVKAWRYPDAWARQFRNQLAETADREFAILAGFYQPGKKGSGAAGETASYEDRVRAALTPAGRAARSWHRLVALEVVRALRYRIQGTKKKPSAASFFRLYVDGDINTEDNIVEWMKVCFDIGPGGELVSKLKRHIECYGYSKCWQQFVNAEAFLPGMQWPTNYSLNMSADSIYRVTDEEKRDLERQEKRGLGSLTTAQRKTHEEKQKSLAVQERAYALPIRRGYFESIDLTAAVKQLEITIDPSSPTGLREFKVPPPSQTPFPFDEGRIRTLVRIDRELNAAPSESQTVAASQKIAGELGLAWVAKFDRTTPPTYSAQIRSSLYRTWFAKLMDETDFGRIVERELAQDDLDQPIPRNDAAAEARAIDAWRSKTAEEKRKDAIKKAEKEGRDVSEALAKVEAKLGSRADTLASKRYQDKALALALHETLWAFGQGGSCPLICGNCPDTTGDDPVAEPVHRCASKGAFKGAVIHIGRH